MEEYIPESSPFVHQSDDTVCSSGNSESEEDQNVDERDRNPCGMPRGGRGHGRGREEAVREVREAEGVEGVEDVAEVGADGVTEVGPEPIRVRNGSGLGQLI